MPYPRINELNSKLVILNIRMKNIILLLLVILMSGFAYYYFTTRGQQTSDTPIVALFQGTNTENTSDISSSSSNIISSKVKSKVSEIFSIPEEDQCFCQVKTLRSIISYFVFFLLWIGFGINKSINLLLLSLIVFAWWSKNV